MAEDYRIIYGAMDQFKSFSNTKFSSWMNSMQAIHSSMARIVQQDSFQGKTADNVKSYLAEVHGMLLNSIDAALKSFQAKYMLYRDGYRDIESSPYAELPKEVFDTIENKLNTEYNFLTDIDKDEKDTLNSISDIIALTAPNVGFLQNDINEIKNDIKTFREEIGNFESAKKSKDCAELEQLIELLEKTICGFIASGTNPSSYNAGDCKKNQWSNDLKKSTQINQQYVNDHIEEIEEAIENEQKDIEQKRIDFEAACQQREDDGRAQMIAGVFIAAGGVAAIVLTAGAATPVVATACVAGVSTCAYGASKVQEGYNRKELGENGDITTAPQNSVKDIIFMGNEDAYNAWGETSQTVAGLCIPVGNAGKAVAGVGKIGSASAKAAATEFAKDAAIDGVTGFAVDQTSEYLGLSEYEKDALSSGVGFVSDMRGVYDYFHGSPFTDGMDIKDAARYNQHWESLKPNN